MSERLIELTVRDRIATVAFDRPDRLNAVSTPLLERLVDVFAEINDRADIWCVILKGNGRAFCVGADQKERPGMSPEEVRRRRRIGPRAFSSMRECVRPVIAQVHGYALGSGLEMAIGSDIVVAAEGTVFGMIETVLGAIPGGGATALLPRIIGLPRARELIYTGRRFSAEDALRWGMISYVVPAAELEAKALSLAREICAAAPIAVAQAKKAMNLFADTDLASGMRLEAELYDRTIATKDRAEALRAYAEKRPPVFRGE
ncbi:MAG: enoyl-CoA hydratase/isomerase family protein [Chloroflexota bacterium]|nr:enoyl-CoA hydratase/isomerase family protein [Chloroflexota bacterium]